MSKVYSKKEKLEQLLLSSFDDVFKLVEVHAAEFYDGHFTIISFTAGVKAMFGTIDLGCGRYDLLKLPAYPDTQIALAFALVEDEKYVVGTL